MTSTQATQLHTRHLGTALITRQECRSKAFDQKSKPLQLSPRRRVANASLRLPLFLPSSPQTRTALSSIQHLTLHPTPPFLCDYVTAKLLLLPKTFFCSFLVIYSTFKPQPFSRPASTFSFQELWHPVRPRTTLDTSVINTCYLTCLPQRKAL